VGIGVKEAEQPFKNLYEVSCLVEVKGKLHGMDYKETKEAEVRITLDLCKDCSRRKGGYYEAILQIRGEVPGEIQNKVRNMLDSLTKKDRRSFITDVKALKEGVDFYIGSIRAARKVARNLKQEYGGRIRESPKLMGMDKHGKKVYRVTIALRLQ
jgi:nonsense-mediated mRNA decay protein 3